MITNIWYTNNDSSIYGNFGYVLYLLGFFETFGKYVKYFYIIIIILFHKFLNNLYEISLKDL